MTKTEQLLNKALDEFHALLTAYELGRYPIDYSFIFEELQFLKLLDIDCVEDSYFNALTEYFLNNEYPNTVFRRMQ